MTKWHIKPRFISHPVHVGEAWEIIFPTRLNKQFYLDVWNNKPKYAELVGNSEFTSWINTPIPSTLIIHKDYNPILLVYSLKASSQVNGVIWFLNQADSISFKLMFK